MSLFFKGWDDARKAAVVNARAYAHDYGIEKVNEFGTKGFRVFMLPKPENRYGHELRCEVVKASDPL